MCQKTRLMGQKKQVDIEDLITNEYLKFRIHQGSERRRNSEFRDLFTWRNYYFNCNLSSIYFVGQNKCHFLDIQDIGRSYETIEVQVKTMLTFLDPSKQHAYSLYIESKLFIKSTPNCQLVTSSAIGNVTGQGEREKNV